MNNETAIIAKWGYLPYFRRKSRASIEWSSACPACGEEGHDPFSGPPDRFFIQDERNGYGPHGKCRQCGHLEWLYDSDNRPEITLAVRRQHAETLRRARKERVQALTEASWWRGFHTAMEHQHRQLWLDTGVPEWAIAFHQLGYAPARDDFSEALTIPYFAQDHETVLTVQLRLLHPEPGQGKYRFARNTQAALFRPWPTDELTGVVLMLEGAKKGLVTYDMASDVTYRGAPVRFCATPSGQIPQALTVDLEDAETIILCLDPDCHVAQNGQDSAVRRNVELLGRDRCRVMRLSYKIDDGISRGLLTLPELQARLEQSEPWLWR